MAISMKLFRLYSLKNIRNYLPSNRRALNPHFMAKKIPFLIILSLMTGCSSKAELKTEVDQATGATTVSTDVFEFNVPENYSSMSMRPRNPDGPIAVQFVKVEPKEGETKFEIH